MFTFTKPVPTTEPLESDLCATYLPVEEMVGFEFTQIDDSDWEAFMRFHDGRTLFIFKSEDGGYGEWSLSDADTFYEITFESEVVTGWTLEILMDGCSALFRVL